MTSKTSLRFLLVLMKKSMTMYNRTATQIIEKFIFISALNGRLCQKAFRFLGSHNRPFLVGSKL